MLPYTPYATLRIIQEERISSVQRLHPVGAEGVRLGKVFMRLRRAPRCCLAWLGSRPGRPTGLIPFLHNTHRTGELHELR
jgi:hypothetical protein